MSITPEQDRLRKAAARQDPLFRKKEYLSQLRHKRKAKIKAVEYLGGKCCKCLGTFHPACFDFHHRDPLVKDARVSQLLAGSWEKAKVEIDKCDLVCANCHRLIHIRKDLEDNVKLS